MSDADGRGRACGQEPPAGVFQKEQLQGFVWADGARLFDAQGAEQAPVTYGGTVIAERPAVRAVALALAASAGGAGGVFRVGGGAQVPQAGAVPMLETLTSGSMGGHSGGARRVRRTQGSWIAGFAVNARLFGIGPGVRVATLGGMGQSLALYAALEGLHLGAQVHLLDGLRPDRQRAALALRAVEVVYATPSQLRLMVGAGDPCPALRVIVVGGAKLDARLRAGLRGMAPQAAVREFYGAAEASFITLAEADTPEASVGRAYPGVEIRVEGPGKVRGGAGDGVGEVGQIWVRSPYTFDGYAGAAAGGVAWRRGWLSVGEYGRLEDGYLYLSGRAGRMVTVADQNVFPEEIEAFLESQPGVERAGVLPRPDGLRGVVLVAVLMGDAGCEAAVLAAARAAFGPLRTPRAVVWCRDWPVLASGKTDFVALALGVA